MPKLFVSAGIQNLENAKFYSCHINLVTVLQSTFKLFVTQMRLKKCFIQFLKFYAFIK